MIIERPDQVEEINSIDNWTLVYGRKKTGKTFLVKNYTDWNDYFFVKRDRTIFNKDSGSMSYDAFMEVLRRNVEEGKTAVIDEFHRLPDEFMDALHDISTGGKIILISSTLHLSKEIISSGSPLLGLFAEVPIHIIDLKDTLSATESFEIGPKERMELSVVLREPIAARFLGDELKQAGKVLQDVIKFSRNSIPMLLGEIFSEEERQLSATYEGILRSIADGNHVSGEISSYLYSKGLIKKDDPSSIQNHLKNLMDLGILKRVKVYNKNRYKYKLKSPLIQLFYYADEKYNITERGPSFGEIKEIIDDNFPNLVEDEVREHLAEKHGLRESVIETPDYDVDVCLLEFQEPEMVGEVKWKEDVEQKDVKRAEEVLSHVEVDRRFIFVPDKEEVTSETLEVLDVTDL